MPAAPRRRDDITAAVDAYNRAHPNAPLPRPAARLLRRHVRCRRRLPAEPRGAGGGGLQRDNITRTVRALVEAGLVSRQASTSRAPYIYRLHLPAPVQSVRAPPREGIRARPRRAAGRQRQGSHSGLRARLERPATASRASTRVRSPAPSWRSWRRCCGASTTAAPAAASRATRRSPRRRSAAGPPSMRRCRCSSWLACCPGSTG